MFFLEFKCYAQIQNRDPVTQFSECSRGLAEIIPSPQVPGPREASSGCTLGNLPGVFCRYNIVSQHETRIGVQVVNELIVQGAPSAQNEIGGFPAPAITRRAVLGRGKAQHPADTQGAVFIKEIVLHTVLVAQGNGRRPAESGIVTRIQCPSKSDAKSNYPVLLKESLFLRGSFHPNAQKHRQENGANNYWLFHILFVFKFDKAKVKCAVPGINPQKGAISVRSCSYLCKTE